MIYRTEVWNGKQYPELHELEIGLGFRGRKEKEIQVPYVHWPEFCCGEEKMDSHEHKYTTQAASLQWDRSGEGSGTEL